MSILFTFGMSVVPLAFVGHNLGERDLAGASVGYFIMCILVMYPIIGLTFAMDTLCSHEYGRNTLSTELGLILQRGVLLNIFMLIPLCWILFDLKHVLHYFYTPSLTQVAEDFLTFSPLYIFPEMILIAMTKFLNNQMQPQIPLIALTVGFVLVPLVQLKLTPLGVTYTMIGMAITAWIQLIVMLAITFFKEDTRATLGTWRIQEALDWTDVKKYLKLAIPSAIFVAAEASSFDFTVLLSAQIDEAEGAAWSGIINSLFIFASFAGGLSTASCANIGRCIGADEPKSAQRYVILSVLLSFAFGVLNSVILISFYDFLMSLYGIQGQTLVMARHVLYILPFFLIADSIQFTFQGIFSGLGKNHLGAAILLISLWCIGVPISFILGQPLGLNIVGVCLGITIGLCIEAPCMIYFASSIDYQLICDKFIDYDDEDDDEESDEEEEEEFDKEYIEEVMRRSGISITNNDMSEVHDYKRLKPPRQRGRRRSYVVMDESDA
ncbi:unnamed protein product [Phytomonas sp. Hart1]|nr:unnamed protein product [Phytomonas sp. Hart1]|eukprot:CCW71106.1 unnamed protein product [Phytomonas sp. isolate Hart1]